MVNDGKITLTLGELKEYFKIWHKNNFNELHEQTKNIIGEYLNQNGIQAKVDIINDIKGKIISTIQTLSKIIDGQSILSESSTLEDAATELINKYNIFKTRDYNNLTTISNTLTNHTTSISTLNNQKASIEYVDNEISNINDALGIVPKQLQTQNIPVIDFGNNLNNYKTPGIYRSKNASNTSNLINVPSKAQSSAFVLVVLQHMDNSVRQLLLTSEASAVGNRFFTRNYINSSNSWSSWYELYGEHNTQPLQMKVEWSNNSNPTTYTLLQVRE